eukprot:4881045-Prymnesium_polylepis.1
MVGPHTARRFADHPLLARRIAARARVRPLAQTEPRTIAQTATCALTAARTFSPVATAPFTRVLAGVCVSRRSVPPWQVPVDALLGDGAHQRFHARPAQQELAGGPRVGAHRPARLRVEPVPDRRAARVVLDPVRRVRAGAAEQPHPLKGGGGW